MNDYVHLNFFEAIWSGMVEIYHHKLRSILTVLGVILGTMAIIAMTSLVEGAKEMVATAFEQVGFDGVLLVSPKQPEDRWEKQKFEASEGLNNKDLKALASRTEFIAAVTPYMQSNMLVSYKNQNLNKNILGTDTQFLYVRNRFVSDGRFIAPVDVRTAASIAVLGDRLKKEMFGDQSPVGEKISVEGRLMTVVGVLGFEETPMSEHGGKWPERDGVLLPYTFYQQYFTGNDSLHMIGVKVESKDSIDSAFREVNRILKVSHRGVEDFEVQNIAAEFAEAETKVQEMIGTWNVILAAIAGMSLLVGGIGILSVMLISIHERTFEIGLRKAIGATNRSIFAQFIIESLTLSSAGALTGATLGAVIIFATSGYFPIPLTVSKIGAALTVSFAMFIGIVFGWYPAYKAAGLEPVDALRG